MDWQTAMTKEALQVLERSTKPIRKMAAILEIKRQPFYGKPLFTNTTGVLTIRRPARYVA